METTRPRNALAFFIAALLALSLVPFGAAAYAEPGGEDGSATDPAANEDVLLPEGGDDASPETPSEADQLPAAPSAPLAASEEFGTRALADATVTSFTELQAAISAITSDADPKGTIIIANDFSFDSMIEINQPCEILIQGGNNTLTAAASRHFQISGGAKVTVEDAIFDGASTAGGINIINKGELAIERTTLQNCSAPSGQGGGAMRTYGNTAANAVKLTISDNCVFKDNVANALNPHNAGALELSRNTTFTMEDSSFEGNAARGTGGAVYAIGGSTTQQVDATFTNVTFHDNESIESQGGGIAIKDYATVVFDTCTFTENKAYSSGGGLFTDRYCDITITDCEFLRNSASGSTYAAAGGLGVALYDNPATSFTMTGTLVDGNTSSRNAGGMSFNTFTQYEISDCTITNNSAAQQGGGVYVGSAVSGTEPTSLTLTDCTVSDNTALVGGGLFGGSYTNSSQVEYFSEIKLQGTTVSDNVATQDGGGVYMEKERYAYLHADAATTFSGNTAATLHDLTDPALIATHAANILTATRSTTHVNFAYNNYDVNQVVGPQIVLTTIEYKANGGTGADFSETVLASSTYNAKTAADVGFSKGTDEFLYWTTTSNPEDPAAVRYNAGEAVALPSDGSTVTLHAQWKAPVPAKSLSIARLFGADRYSTSKQVATYERDVTTEPVLIVASGADRNFPDALSASSLSGVNGNAPILLTEPTALSADTRAVIAAATSVTKVYILGDQYAVSDAVEAEIASLASGAHIVRIGGEGRQQTAELVYSELGSSASKTAIIARSMNFPDSLSISSWAALTASPIFLSDFTEQGLMQSTVDALVSGGFERILVLGDQYSVPDAVVNQALAATGLDASKAVRLGGDDRVETSLEIAEWTTDAARGATEQLSFDNLAVARAEKHADALAGGALQGKHGSVVLLTWPEEVHPSVVSAITGASSDISEIRFFGDEYSVSVPLMRAYVGAIQFDQHTWKPDNSVAFDLN
ncbi:cell wall-binding repeat-containing protein [Raoultibacter phocaeensis]|uniref:cell wall-binding repeat-containing protein n=1 Tax=Raoultibacter phocaeensis TaxID=2479841 RepID=UPI0015D61A5C|nr:cell wall-binding repeat-containing protein [Raoultibacter phocaeensis]